MFNLAARLGQGLSDLARHPQPARAELPARSAKLALVGAGQQVPTFTVLYAPVIFRKWRDHGLKRIEPFYAKYIVCFCSILDV